MQRHVDDLFAGVDANQLSDMLFVCTVQVTPPGDFADQWFCCEPGANFETEPRLTAEALQPITGIIAIADLTDEQQRESFANLTCWASNDPHDAQPILLLPITARSGTILDREAVAVTRKFVESGSVDDVLWHAPSGFPLVLAIKAKMQSFVSMLRRVQEEYHQRTTMLETSNRLLATLDSARWDYMRSRRLHAIPPRQENLGEEGGHSVVGLRIGRKLTRLLFGTVHVTTPDGVEPEAAAAMGQRTTMLVVRKINIRSMLGMQMINRYLQVLTSLRRMPHPNLPHLITAIQSPTRLYVQIRQNSAVSLFHALKMRDDPKVGAERVPLREEVLVSIARQICKAVTHLHEVAGVCHRDIKPDIVMIEEATEAKEVGVTLSGFELSAQGRHMRTPCGTMPFAAPEVISAGREGYDSMASDMWSLGITFLELACGLGCVDRALPKMDEPVDSTPTAEPIGFKQAPRPPSQSQADRIIEEFSRPGVVGEFFDRCVPEAVGLRPWMQPLVESLLQVVPGKRRTAANLLQAMPEV